MGVGQANTGIREHGNGPFNHKNRKHKEIAGIVTAVWQWMLHNDMEVEGATKNGRKGLTWCSLMAWIIPSFASISAERMGDGSYPNVRSRNRHWDMPGGRTSQISKVSVSTPTTFFIATFRSPTVSLFPMLIGKAPLDLRRIQRKSLKLSSEPMIMSD